jgi:protein-disulfide isomerase
MQERQGAEQVRLEVENFEKKGRLKILAKAPVAPLVNLELTGLPFKGAENSKVVVVEASDYLCPHCRHAIDEVEKVLKEYSGKVKFVQANFALRPTGLSGALVRGAWCANKQGNDAFWKYHEKAFAVPQEAATPVSPNTEKAFADTAIKVAQDAGINVKDFETCLASEDSKKGMEANNSKLTSVGVTGTPTFFVNNRKIGAPGNLSSAISAEIEKISANPSKAN